MQNVLGMSVVGSDYDELKQYNLAEIYDPTPKSNTKTGSGVATMAEDKDDSTPSDVAVKGSGLENDVIHTERGQADKTSLDLEKAADGAHLTTS